MTPAEQLAAMDAWLASHPTPNIPRDTSPLAFEDEETLRRSRRAHIAPPTIYRRRADHPTEPWCDDIAAAAGEYREAS